MTQRDTASLAFKLIGLYAIIQAFIKLPDFISFFAFRPGPNEAATINVPLAITGQIIGIVFLFALGLFLISSSRALAAATVQDSDSVSIPSQPSFIDICIINAI